jgi:hypothetical protein
MALAAHKRQKRAAVLFLSTLLSACTTSGVSVERDTTTGAKPGDAIAFVFSPGFSLATRRAEESEIIGCISDAVAKAHPALRIVGPDEFRRVVFPDLAREAAPSKPEFLTLLLKHPRFKERVSSIGVRYLISVVGGTEQTGGPAAGAIGGMGAAVIVVAGSWDRTSSLTASVIDLERERTVGKLGALATGHPWVLVIFPSPVMIGAPAFTEAKACADLGEAVAKFIADGDTLEAKEIER